MMSSSQSEVEAWTPQGREFFPRFGAEGDVGFIGCYVITYVSYNAQHKTKVMSSVFARFLTLKSKLRLLILSLKVLLFVCIVYVSHNCPGRISSANIIRPKSLIVVCFQSEDIVLTQIFVCFKIIFIKPKKAKQSVLVIYILL